jgi:hypothetical protein
METSGQPSSASSYAGYRQDKITSPESASRYSPVRNPSTFYYDTPGSTLPHTSYDAYLHPAQYESPLRGRRTRQHSRRDRFGHNPSSEFIASERHGTQASTHTQGLSPSVQRLSSTGHPTDTPMCPKPLQSTPLRSCLKGARATASCLTDSTFQKLDTNHTVAETQHLNDTSRGQESTSPPYINGGKSQHLHYTTHDSRTLASNLFSQSRNLPSSLRTKAPRTQTVYHHKSRRGPKKKKKNRKHKRREPTNDFPDSTHPQYTQRTRHRRKHATERSENDHEKRHNRYTHRQITDRHTSYSSPMRNDTRPSVIRTERRTKHQRARHPSEASEWYAPHTDRTRTHHARPSRIHRTPHCRVIQTTRTTKGYRHR